VKKRKPVCYQVRWINPRSIERLRNFTDFNKALNFFARFPYGRAGLFSNERKRVTLINGR
jgi:hypothetical protein